ncbi:MAG: hypothetical protein ACLSE4_09720 [Clostridium sp.]
MLKMKWNVSELVTSIMFNYVVQFLRFIWSAITSAEVSSSSLASLKFEETAGLPVVIPGPGSMPELYWVLCYVSWCGFSCTGLPWAPGFVSLR